jgi:hypothetical protein
MGSESLQNIEGWGGDRSRNVNAITKAMKLAITGGTKGPGISSHPHHIDIKNKLDGTANFKCMRINFDSRADRNLFCQDRLAIQQIRAYAINIQVGQEEGGTKMNASTMTVNWCEEELVEKKKGIKPTHESTTITKKNRTKKQHMSVRQTQSHQPCPIEQSWQKLNTSPYYTFPYQPTP